MTTNLTMRTAAAAALALLMLVLLPGAANAQDFDCNADATGEDSAPYPVGRGDVAIGATVVTPNAQIEVDGVDWSCNTTVEITITTEEGRSTVTTATVAEDGTFNTEVTIPADVTSEVTVEVAGTDSRGEARTTTTDLAVQTLASPVGGTDVLTELGASNDMTPFILGGAALALVLGSGTIVLMRRRTA